MQDTGVQFEDSHNFTVDMDVNATSFGRDNLEDNSIGITTKRKEEKKCKTKSENEVALIE